MLCGCPRHAEASLLCVDLLLVHPVFHGRCFSRVSLQIGRYEQVWWKCQAERWARAVWLPSACEDNILCAELLFVRPVCWRRRFSRLALHAVVGEKAWCKCQERKTQNRHPSRLPPLLTLPLHLLTPDYLQSHPDQTPPTTNRTPTEDCCAWKACLHMPRAATQHGHTLPASSPDTPDLLTLCYLQGHPAQTPPTTKRAHKQELCI